MRRLGPRRETTWKEGVLTKVSSVELTSALGKPRFPLASFVLSFTYLVVPLAWITGFLLCFFISWFLPETPGLAYFFIFCLWVVCVQLFLVVLIDWLRSGIRIVLIRKFTHKASNTSAKIVEPFALYGSVKTVYGFHEDSKDNFLISITLNTDKNLFRKLIANPLRMGIGRSFDCNNWKSGVEALIKQADVVVVDILHGKTSHIDWEIAESRRHLPINRIVFLVSSDTPEIPDWATRITLRPGIPGYLSIWLRFEIYRVMSEIAQRRAFFHRGRQREKPLS